MKPYEFLKTIYLHDRACKNILIDGWGERVLFQIDKISRIRSSSGEWEFYDKEDIDDGYIVFTGVDSIKFSPEGLIPNDQINSIEVDPISVKISAEKEIKKFKFRIIASSGNKYTLAYQEVLIEIIADGIHLENPALPGIKIIE